MKYSTITIIILSVAIGILIFTNIQSCNKKCETSTSTPTIDTVTIVKKDTLYVIKEKLKYKKDTIRLKSDTSVIYTYSDEKIDSNYSVWDTIEIKNNEIISHKQRIQVKERIVTITDTKYITEYVRDTLTKTVFEKKVPFKFLYGATYSLSDANNKTDFALDVGFQTNVGHFRVSKSIFNAKQIEFSVAIPFNGIPGIKKKS